MRQVGMQMVRRLEEGVSAEGDRHGAREPSRVVYYVDPDVCVKRGACSWQVGGCVVHREPDAVFQEMVSSGEQGAGNECEGEYSGMAQERSDASECDLVRREAGFHGLQGDQHPRGVRHEAVLPQVRLVRAEEALERDQWRAAVDAQQDVGQGIELLQQVSDKGVARASGRHQEVQLEIRGLHQASGAEPSMWL